MLRERVVERLSANAEVFQGLVKDVSSEQARWRPTHEKWSIVEVVCHLADEERDDFRRRLDLTLHHPGEPWPPIDPPRWAVERNYNARDLASSLADFLAERRRSLEWLRGLADIDLEASCEHPGLGRLTAGDLLVSWLAHDLIHVRQIDRLHFEYLSAIADGYSPAYAGDW
jgi:hypothetical protein